MAVVEKAPDAFRTISEVADEIDVPQHVLRFTARATPFAVFSAYCANTAPHSWKTFGPQAPNLRHPSLQRTPRTMGQELIEASRTCFRVPQTTPIAPDKRPGILRTRRAGASSKWRSMICLPAGAS